jgi:hypothetical protein
MLLHAYITIALIPPSCFLKSASHSDLSISQWAPVFKVLTCSLTFKWVPVLREENSTGFEEVGSDIAPWTFARNPTPKAA